MRRPAPVRLERRIRVHDRKHFELKLEYEPDDPTHHSTYIVEAYLCLPASLNINEDIAPAHELYADIKNYIRLKTPEHSWTALEGAPGSPLVRVEEELRVIERGAPPARFEFECRLFATVFRGRLRDFLDETDRLVGKRAGARELEELSTVLEATLVRTGVVLSRFRQLFPRMERDGIPESARAAFRLADEWASVSFEQRMRRALVILSRAALDEAAEPAAAKVKGRILEAILAEEQHRRVRAYRTIIDRDTDNEVYVSRAGLLKKYCSSALFLEIVRRGAPRRWLELAFATAAGIAMAGTLIVTFWAQQKYANVSLQLFVILVVAYMLKDRVKEGARQMFWNALSRRLWDRRVLITDPVGERLGECREKIAYCEGRDLPAEIRRFRRQGDDWEAEAEAELDETIIHYSKKILLQPSEYFLRRGGGGGVTDIVRFAVHRWLRDMDEAFEKIEFMDRETLTLTPLRAAKVYRVEVVFRFREREEAPASITMLRLVLDRRGIRRIERVDPDGRITQPRLSALP